MKIEVAHSTRDMTSVWKLNHDTYVASGFLQPKPSGLYRSYPHLDFAPQTTVFLCKDHSEQVIGSLSYTLDLSQALPIDSEYHAWIERFKENCKATGKRFGICWRLITQRTKGARITAALFSENINYGMRLNIDYTFFLCSHQHAHFYERAFGFKVVAGPVKHAHLQTESVLLLGDVKQVSKEWAKIRTRRTSRRLAIVHSG